MAEYHHCDGWSAAGSAAGTGAAACAVGAWESAEATVAPSPNMSAAAVARARRGLPVGRVVVRLTWLLVVLAVARSGARLAAGVGVGAGLDLGLALRRRWRRGGGGVRRSRCHRGRTAPVGGRRLGGRRARVLLVRSLVNDVRGVRRLLGVRLRVVVPLRRQGGVVIPEVGEDRLGSVVPVLHVLRHREQLLLVGLDVLLDTGKRRD